MLGAFAEGLFKGLDFHEKLYDVKHKRMLSRAADEYLKQKEGDDTKAPLPTGNPLGGDGSQGSAAGGTAGGGSENPLLAWPQTKSATAADEPRSKPADEPKPTSQKLKEQATGSVSEGDILPNRGPSGLPAQPIPSGGALGIDASQNMEGPQPRPTGVFRPSTVADYRPPSYPGQVANKYFASPLGTGLAGLGTLAGQAPAAIGTGVTALGDFGRQAVSGLLPRPAGSTIVDPNYFDPNKSSY